MQKANAKREQDAIYYKSQPNTTTMMIQTITKTTNNDEEEDNDDDGICYAMPRSADTETDLESD